MFENLEDIVHSMDEWHLDFLIIGIGVQGCAAVATDPTRELLSDRKHAHIHYKEIDNSIKLLQSSSELSAFLQNLPAADMAFIVTGSEDSSDIELSACLAKHLQTTTYSVMAMALMPINEEQEEYDLFKPLIYTTNTTHIIHPKEAHLSMVKIFQCIIDVSCIFELICVDYIDVGTIFGSRGHCRTQDWSFGHQAFMGYGIAYGNEYSQRAKRAAEQMLQNISLPAGKKLEDARSALYAIKSSKNISGDEILTIGTIISNALFKSTNIIFTAISIDDEEYLETQLIVVFDNE